MAESIKRSLKILHLASSERWTGVADPVTSLARLQQEGGHQVWLGCVPGKSFARMARKQGLFVLEDLRLSRRFHPLSLWRDLHYLPRFFREEQPDIVHCHLPHDHWTAWLTAATLPAEGRPRLVRTLHGTGPPRNDPAHSLLFRKGTDGLICLSQAQARDAAQTWKLNPARVRAIGGGVDLKRFHPGESGLPLRVRLDIPRKAPVAGMVARMKKGRGLRWLLAAAPEVLRREERCHLVVVGRGEMKDWFKAEIQKPIYQGRVHYAGYCSAFVQSRPRKPNLAAAYCGMDVALFLGLTSEGSCRSLLEAMACGRPGIGLNRGAVPDIIDHGETGLLVRPGDKEDLAEKMVTLLHDRSQCHRLGERALEKIQRCFTPEIRAEKTVAFYQEILSEDR